MARDRKREKIVKKLLAKYVSDIQFGTSVLGHSLMLLTYVNGHQMTVRQTFEWERMQSGKLPHQVYCIKIFGPDDKVVSNSDFLTAKMVKLAILKTKALDMLKGR